MKHFLFGLAALTISFHSAFAKQEYCAAIQGNGRAIFGHFHSLARLISEYGVPKKTSGTSSGTITQFLFESMMLNPAIDKCADCSEQEIADRLSLMLKSLVGFFEGRQSSREWTTVTGAIEIATILQEADKKRQLGEPHKRRIEEILKGISEKGSGALASYLGILANRRFGQVLHQSTNKKFHIEDYSAALGKDIFQFDSPKIFLRPFPISFEGLATVFGWIGDFYAGHGYQNEAKWNEWFQACGSLRDLKDKSWGEIAYVKYDRDKREEFIKNRKSYEKTPCLLKFEALLADYDVFDKVSTPKPSRVDQKVGTKLDAIVVTGLLVGNAHKEVLQAKKDYWEGADKLNTPEYQLGVNFEKEYLIGFMGTDASLKTAYDKVLALRKEKGDRLDEKVRRFTPLPGFTWRKALETSPAEPSISETVNIDVLGKPGSSIGGWADAEPTTILKLAGCEKVVFISTEYEKNDLLMGISALIGGKQAEERFFSPKPVPGWGDSSHILGLRDSDAVWCTNWMEIPGSDLAGVYEMTEKTFRAGLQTTDEFFKRTTYPTSANLNRPGCSIRY